MLNQKKSACIMTGLAVLLICSLFVGLYHPNTEAQTVNVLNVQIDGPEKLHVNEPATFTTNVDGSYFGKLTYIWSVDPADKITLASNGASCTVTYTEATEEPYVLKVEVHDEGQSFGVGTKQIMDPASYPSLYLGVYGAPYTYLITVDESGSWYYAINGKTGQVSTPSTNCSDVINSALQLGNTFLRDGTYYCQYTINLVSGHWLKGESTDGTIIKVPNSQADTFTHEGTEVPLIFYKSESIGKDFGVYDLTIDTNQANTPSIPLMNPISLFSAHIRATIQNIKVLAFKGTNVGGIFDLQGQEDIISFNHIENGQGASSEGIYIFQTNNSTFQGNYIDTMGREGFYLADSTDGTGSSGNNKFIGNTVVNCGAEAFDARCIGDVFSDNIIKNCADGIYLTSPNCTVIGNTISVRSNAISLDFGRGSQSASDCNIVGNNIVGGNRGIFVNGSNGAVRNIIDSNHITSCGTGLNIYGNAQSGCTGNSIYYCVLGIDLNGAQGNSITGGTITNSDTAAIYTRANSNYNNIANINAGSNNAGKGILDLAASAGVCTNRYTACWNNSWSWIATYGSGT